MITIPLPLCVALLLGFFCVRLVINERRIAALAGLVALCTMQSLVILLAQSYGLPAFRTLQPVTAVLIPPAAWMAYQVSAKRAARPLDALHLLLPGFTAFCLLAARGFLDLVVPLGFVAYGIALLVDLKSEKGDLPRLALGAGQTPSLLWRGVALALIASASSDALIVLAQILGRADLQPLIISLFTSLSLLMIGLLALSRDLAPAPNAPEETVAQTTPDLALMARLETLMQTRKPFLEPDLTLGQLARKLAVPQKELSSTINAATGENVSRYINGLRIHCACAALREGQDVTRAMFDCGFNTKSNFNREFKRVTGKSPSQWKSDCKIEKAL